MHVRVAPLPKGKFSVQLAESYREGGQVRKRIVRHIGSAWPGEELELMRQVAHLELERMHNKSQGALFPNASLADMAIDARQRRRVKVRRRMRLADLEEEQRLVLGIHEVFGELYERADLHRVFTKRKVMAQRLLRDEVMMRLARPGRSKRAHARQMADSLGATVSLDKLYRMMDALDDGRIAKLQELVGRQSASLQGDKIEVLFADATTLYFEATRPDVLRRRGWSKGGKPHRLQVVLAVVMAANGLPLGYRLYPGNTTDVDTLLPALADFKQSWKPTQPLVVVADAGMLPKKSMAALEAAGCGYILAAGMRQLPAALLELACDLDSYGPADETGLRRRDLLWQGRRLVLNYNPKHAARTKRGREGELLKAEKAIRSGNILHNRYLQTSDNRAVLNLERFAADERLDGIHGVWTSLQDMDAAQVRRHHGALSQIERSFRVLEHDLAARPMFHWTERRVRAHVAICFAALALLSTLSLRMRMHESQFGPISEGRLLEELCNVQASVIIDTRVGKRALLPSKPTKLQKAIYRCVNLPLTQDLFDFE